MAIDFGLTDEQKMMLDTVRKFCEKECPKEKVAEWDNAGKDFPLSLWKKLGEIGILGVGFPEEYGGTPGGMIDEALIAEELSYGFNDLALAYLLGVSFGGYSILHQGNKEQIDKHLPLLINGETNFALGMTEPGGGLDVLGALKTKGREDGDNFIINGTKIFTTGMHIADTIVLVVRTDDVPGKPALGLTLFLVDKNTPGITYNKLEKLGSHTCGTFEVVYEDVKVHKSNILGERGKGWYQILGTLNNERIIVASMCNGLSRCAFDEALQYSKEREAFGKPIGGHMAIQHYLAEMATEIETARLLTYKAAYLVDHAKTNAELMAAGGTATMCKYWASEVAGRVTDRGMRILAGYGFMQEYHMQRYFRNCRQYIFAPITNEMAKNIIGQMMLGLPKSY
jgi:acyl-CoA dehydrogenase